MRDDVPPTTRMEPGFLFAGRYRVDDVLGRGAMGEVHCAYDTKLRRRVALKLLIHASGELGARRTERLFREARAVAALNHPHVVAVYDVGDEHETPFIVMELVEGGSLAARAAAGRRPTTEQALDWLEQIADALASAHRAGFVHRDIKPDNLLVDREGRVKVADFGIAKELEPGLHAWTSAHALTAAGRMIGTPRYMAPEQLRAEAVDGRVDLFAWGVVAFELLAGAHPYDLTETPTTPQLVADGLFVPVSLTARVPGVSPDVERILFRAVAAEPSARGVDMTTMLQALRDARRIRARTDPMAPPIAHGSSPALPPAPTLPPAQPLFPTAPPPAPRKRSEAPVVAIAVIGLFVLVVGGGFALWLLGAKKAAGPERTALVAGGVYISETSEAIVGASVCTNGTCTTADASGAFQLRALRGETVISATAPGYGGRLYPVIIRSDQRLNIGLPTEKDDRTRARTLGVDPADTTTGRLFVTPLDPNGRGIEGLTITVGSPSAKGPLYFAPTGALDPSRRATSRWSFAVFGALAPGDVEITVRGANVTCIDDGLSWPSSAGATVRVPIVAGMETRTRLRCVPR